MQFIRSIVISGVAALAILTGSCNSSQSSPGNQAVISKKNLKPGTIRKMVSYTYYDVKFLDQGWVPADTSDYHKETYLYNKDGLPAEYFWNAKRNRVYAVHELFQYKNGKFVDRTIWADTMKLKKTIEWENDSTYREIFFDDNGQPVNEYFKILNSAQKPLIEKRYMSGVSPYSSRYKYNPANELIERFDTSGTDSWSHYIFKAMERDSFGNQTKILVTREDKEGVVTRELISKTYEYY